MSDLTTIFSALSEPTRFAIVERLMEEGELPASEIQQSFDISAPAISRHLSVLYDAGLVQRKAVKQQRIYSVRPQALQQISAWTISHRDFWQASMQRLEDALMKEIKK